MNHRKLVVALAALSIGAANVAFADDHDDREGGHDGRGNGHQQDRGRDRHDERGQYRQDDRHDIRPPDRQDYRRDDGFHGRGAGPEHSFYRGGRLPSEYRSRQYVVDDWRGHHLNAPPRGYHWVQAGGDYVLVAVATGIIVTILLNQ